MATATTKTTAAAASEMPDLAEKIREQVLSTLRQGQQLTVDAAQTWAKAVSVLPAMDLPKVPGIPSLPGVEAATRFTFDMAAQLLTAQRDFALKLADVVITDKHDGVTPNPSL